MPLLPPTPCKAVEAVHVVVLVAEEPEFVDLNHFNVDAAMVLLPLLGIVLPFVLVGIVDGILLSSKVLICGESLVET